MKVFSITIITIITVIFSTPIFAATTFDQVNQKVCSRLEEDVSRLAAIMEEVRRRKGITETRVAFGGVDTPIKSADYSITYAAEAIAFQRAQKFSSKNELRYSLEGLKSKVLKAKNDVLGALDEK